MRFLMVGCRIYYHIAKILRIATCFHCIYHFDHFEEDEKFYDTLFHSPVCCTRFGELLESVIE
ncbi:hypothetical protein C492_07190 [Natronococcus jeotgali DSM 18795]|uniref:Uncharacterized protein n=1 Tax=Natronococcus jeotgali DSM 18795 TaxID=1227498 RepID=L9XNM9_9EURY|nr:hypothetical protein C492_07190 [Natronococcus jeotgali DSM 18795]